MGKLLCCAVEFRGFYSIRFFPHQNLPPKRQNEAVASAARREETKVAQESADQLLSKISRDIPGVRESQF